MIPHTTRPEVEINLGPFRTQYNHKTRRVILKANSDTEPHVYSLSRADFETLAEVVEHSYTANHWDAKAREEEIENCPFKLI